MTGFAVRQATLADFPAVSAIFRRASLSNDADAPHLKAHPDMLRLDDEAIRRGGMRVAVGLDGTVVGFITALENSETLELEDLFVDPDWMRRGIGRQLVRDVVEIAKARGIERVEVTANPQALSFYESLGFVSKGEAATMFGPAPRMELAVL